MNTPADTIREALNVRAVLANAMGIANPEKHAQALAALTELEQRAEAKEPAGTYARITELQAINAQMTRHRDEQAARAVAAEAERDLAISAAQEQRRLREAAEAQLETAEMKLKIAAIDSKVWARVEPSDDPEACWEWTGYKNKNTGYGSLVLGSAHLSAHRAVYEAVYGPIPGLTVDHLCRNRGCVNPRHLEAVTIKENTLRGETVTGLNARKTHCDNGHEFTPENTISDRGGRKCRTCHNEMSKQRKRRLRAEGKL